MKVSRNTYVIREHNATPSIRAYLISFLFVAKSRRDATLLTVGEAKRNLRSRRACILIEDVRRALPRWRGIKGVDKKIGRALPAGEIPTPQIEYFSPKN